MSYNQTLLSRVQERELILEILACTKGWRPGYHNLTSSRAQALLSKYNLRSEILMRIDPILTLRREGVSREYQEIAIDLRSHREGHADCDHIFVQLYWEEGGGCLDPGVPHTYVMCTKCGKAHPRNPGHRESGFWNFVKRVIHIGA
jgi:hypothetical protein